MNGGWFWWGAKDPQQFKNAWIYSFNYLTVTKGLHNLLWVYGPNAGSDAANYYPGSQYVDIVGLDYYGSMNVPQASGYTALLALNKPIALTEFGPCSADGSNCSPQDSTPLIAGIRQNMPKLTFWMSYGDVWSLSHHLNAKQLLQDSWVITRDEISLPGTPPADATPPQAPKGLTVR
jgi:mannan endo-1,4-beta-mannosidase